LQIYLGPHSAFLALQKSLFPVQRVLNVVSVLQQRKLADLAVTIAAKENSSQPIMERHVEIVLLVIINPILGKLLVCLASLLNFKTKKGKHHAKNVLSIHTCPTRLHNCVLLAVVDELLF